MNKQSTIESSYKFNRFFYLGTSSDHETFDKFISYVLEIQCINIFYLAMNCTKINRNVDVKFEINTEIILLFLWISKYEIYH